MAFIEATLVGAGEGELLAQKLLLEGDGGGSGRAAGQHHGAAVRGALERGLENGRGLGAMEHDFGPGSTRELAHAPDHILPRRGNDLGRTAGAGEREAFFVEVDRDDRIGPGQAGELQSHLTDEPHPKNHHRLVDLQPSPAHGVQRHIAQNGKTGLGVGHTVRHALNRGGRGEVDEGMAGMRDRGDYAVPDRVFRDPGPYGFDPARRHVPNVGPGLAFRQAVGGGPVPEKIRFAPGADLGARVADLDLAGGRRRHGEGLQFHAGR
jgi:hypothetical protein